MIHYECKYRYFGNELTKRDRTLINAFLEKYSKHIDGWNFMWFDKDNEWLIFKFHTKQRKIAFFEKYWRSPERNALPPIANNKPWNPTIWRDLPPDNFYKSQMVLMKNNYKHVFQYDYI